MSGRFLYIIIAIIVVVALAWYFGLFGGTQTAMTPTPANPPAGTAPPATGAPPATQPGTTNGQTTTPPANNSGN